MIDTMIDRILHDNKDAVREAGKELVDIGQELVDGKIDEVIERFRDASQKYEAWAELDSAIIDIDAVIRDRQTMIAVQFVLEKMLAVLLAAAIKAAI